MILKKLVLDMPLVSTSKMMIIWRALRRRNQQRMRTSWCCLQKTLRTAREVMTRSEDSKLLEMEWTTHKKLPWLMIMYQRYVN